MRFTFTDNATGEKKFEGALECMQCDFKKSDGVQCKRRTCKMLPYCWQHAQTMLGVKVAPSTIPGAGSGLFATKEFKGSNANMKWIAPLGGQQLTDAQTDARYGAHATAPYTVGGPNGQNFDGALKRYVGHFANSRFGQNNKSVQKGTNAVIGMHNNMPWLKAQIGKTIKPNQEVLAWYGNQFRLENHLYTARTK